MAARQHSPRGDEGETPRSRTGATSAVYQGFQVPRVGPKGGLRRTGMLPKKRTAIAKRQGPEPKSGVGDLVVAIKIWIHSCREIGRTLSVRWGMYTEMHIQIRVIWQCTCWVVSVLSVGRHGKRPQIGWFGERVPPPD